MGVLQFVEDVQKSVSHKTKSVSDSVNLKKKILYEQDRINEIYTEIGKNFYNDRNGDHKELLSLCDDIDQRKRRIKNMKVEVNAIKGLRICPKCHAKFDDSYEFCGKCGSKLIVLQEDN